MSRRFGWFVTLILVAAVCAVFGAYALRSSAAPHPADAMSSAATLPTPGSYKLDQDHSFAFFTARHHVVGSVRGRFDKVNGTITSAANPADCAIDVTIDIASLSTQVPERDADIRGTAYFDEKSFPTMTYRGHGIRHVSGNNWVMDGDLTMHGVTRTVPLTFDYNGVFSDTKPTEPKRVAFHATAGVKRAEFGMGARDNASELGMLTTPDVTIEIDIEADAVAHGS
jgi:polyisoprenoid-binding protein YceI